MELFEIEVIDLRADHGSLLEFIGTVIETGEPVIFYVEHRPGEVIADAVWAGELVVTTVPPYLVRAVGVASVEILTGGGTLKVIEP